MYPWPRSATPWPTSTTSTPTAPSWSHLHPTRALLCQFHLRHCHGQLHILPTLHLLLFLMQYLFNLHPQSSPVPIPMTSPSTTFMEHFFGQPSILQSPWHSMAPSTSPTNSTFPPTIPQPTAHQPQPHPVQPHPAIQVPPHHCATSAPPYRLSSTPTFTMPTSPPPTTASPPSTPQGPANLEVNFLQHPQPTASAPPPVAPILPTTSTMAMAPTPAPCGAETDRNQGCPQTTW